MKILFLTDSHPNYVPDLLLHGLRKLIGQDVIDYPKKQCLYDGVIGLGICPKNQLAPGWFPEDNGEIDRNDVEAKIKKKYFDLIVTDVRSISLFNSLPSNPKSKLVIIDGEDRPTPLPPGNFLLFRRETDGFDCSIPLPMALPEELFHLITSFDATEKTYSIGFLGGTQDDNRKELIEKISGWFPDTLFVTTQIPTTNNYQPEGRLGRNEYYKALQSCYFVISLPGAGYDTFRYWENAAMNGVHIAQQMPLLIPDKFRDEKEFLTFDSPEDFRKKIEKTLGDTNSYATTLAKGRYHLIKHHLTTHRAAYFLEKCHRTFGL